MPTISYVDDKHTVEELGHRVMKAENEVEFAVTNAASGDTCQVLKIPANAKVNRVDVIIKTAEGGALLADVGDGTDPNGWDDNIDLNAAVGTRTGSLEATDPYGPGKFYTAEDTIDLLLEGAADAGVVIVSAEYTLIERYV